jgi:glutaredoxin
VCYLNFRADYLNVAKLKTNLEKRVKRVLADSDKNPPEIRINRTVPAEVSIAGSTVHLFAVNISFLEQNGKKPAREMTLLVDPAGELEFSELSLIATGDNPARKALDLAAKKDVPPGLGDLVFQGNGTAEVLMVSDPFCPYCRLGFRYLKDKKQAIKQLRMLQLPFASHPGARASVLGLFAAASHPGTSFSRAADFAYNTLSPPEKKDKSRANEFILSQFSREFPEAFPSDSQKALKNIQARFETKMKGQIREAEKLGVSATPTIFINGIPVRGFTPEKIDRLLKK